MYTYVLGTHVFAYICIYMYLGLLEEMRVGGYVISFATNHSAENTR